MSCHSQDWIEADITENCCRGLDPAVWQKLPTILIAVIFTKLPILKLVRVVQKCGRAIKQEVMSCPRGLVRLHRSHECFFPAFFDKAGDGWMSAYNVDMQTWSHMPELGFLPKEVNYILAGKGGLLCVTGGGQPRFHADPMEPRDIVPDPAHWDWLNFPPQPVIVVCNPLTRKMRLLPPMQAPLKFPVAHMVMSASGSYALYLMGWNEDDEQMVVTVYSSRWHAWMGWRALSNGLRPANTLSAGTNTCGVLGNELWLAGEVRWAGAWEPRILCFDLRREIWRFVLTWIPGCEAPKVVESDGCLFAATRLTNKPFTVYIFEVVGTCSNTCPRSNYEEITQMPDELHCFFFEIERRKVAALNWECRAGKGIICFHNPRNGRLVWFNVRAHKRRTMKVCWGFTKTKAPHFEPAYTSMGNCLWHPSFSTAV